MYEKILGVGGGGDQCDYPCLNKTLNNPVLLGLRNVKKVITSKKREMG